MINFSQIILDFASKTPDRVALHYCKTGQEDVPISYGDIVEKARPWLAALRHHGVTQGEVVLVILEPSEELIYSYWAAILFGAIPSVVPFQTEKLLPEQYTKELKALISTSKPTAIVTAPKYKAVTDEAVGNARSVRAILTAEDLESVFDQDVFPGTERDSDEIVLLQHSSGTTGLQKGVALSHRAVIQQLEDYGAVLQVNERDVIVSWLPLYHDMGLIAGFLMPLLLGIPLVLLSPFDWVRSPVLLHKKVSKYRGTLSWLPNFAFDFCAQKIRADDLETLDLSSWRAVINCSEVVQSTSLRKFRERFEPYGLRENAPQACYAMAENVFAVTQTDLTSSPMEDRIDADLFRSERVASAPREGFKAMVKVSSGTALPNNEIRITDDAGVVLDERRVGNVLIKSKSLLTEYYNRPQESENAFDGDWYRTGDLGYMVGSELFVTGRKKELIIVGGKNIFPQDIESVVYDVDGVKEGRALAFGLYNESKGTEDVVVIAEVPHADAQQKEDIKKEIMVQVTRKSAVALRNIYLVDAKWLIKTSSGKISRYANKAKYLEKMDSPQLE